MQTQLIDSAESGCLFKLMRAKPLFTIMLITYLPSLQKDSCTVEDAAPGETGSILRLTYIIFLFDINCYYICLL